MYDLDVGGAGVFAEVAADALEDAAEVDVVRQVDGHHHAVVFDVGFTAAGVDFADRARGVVGALAAGYEHPRG